MLRHTSPATTSRATAELVELVDLSFNGIIRVLEGFKVDDATVPNALFSDSASSIARAL